MVYTMINKSGRTDSLSFCANTQIARFYLLEYQMTNYRKLWEAHYGPIPKDHTGRSYEIHHIDGNRENSELINLKLVTIQEHYDIHYDQGDYAACQSIVTRMKMTARDLSEKCSELATLRVINGTHNLVGDKNPIHKRVQDGSHATWLAQHNKKLVSENKHNFQIRPDGSSLSSDRVKNGTHNFTPDICKESWIKSTKKQKEMLDNGTHHSCLTSVCPHCGKEGRGHTMLRWHFDNCRRKPNVC